MGAMIRRLRAMITRSRLDDQLADEIRMHLDLRTGSLIDGGMDPADAAAEARRQFGNVTLKREEARDSWSLRMLESAAQDARYAARLMRKNPIFTAVAVLSLGVGMGASAAVFSLADAMLFKKLAVPAPDQLSIFLWRSGPVIPAESLSGEMTKTGGGWSSTSFSLQSFAAMRREAAGIAEVFGFTAIPGGMNAAIGGRSEVVSGQLVSGNYFTALGVSAVAGRTIVENDDRPDAPPVVVISDRFWLNRFGRSADAIGATMMLNGVAATVVGVSPKGFQGTVGAGDAPALMLPLAAGRTIDRGSGRYRGDVWFLLVMGRFDKAQTPASALRSLDGLFKRSVAESNPTLASSELPALELLPGARGQTESRASRRETLMIMATVAGIVLLVASANVASLLLVRGAARAREAAMRVAIGASRWRIVRQFLTEALLIGAMGSALALVLAQWISAGLLLSLSDAPLDIFDLGIDWRLLAFTAGLGCASSALFGVVPAWRATSAAITASGTLSAVDSRGSVAPPRTRMVGTLVVVQVALAVVLTSVAGLLTRSIWNLQRVELGFNASNLLIFSVNPARNAYDLARIRATYEAALERLAAAPGVVGAAFSTSTLIGAGGSTTVALPIDAPAVERQSAEYRRLESEYQTWRLTVSDRFFETMQIPLLSGRTFTTADTAEARRVAVINRTLALRLFGGIDVVGRRFKVGVTAGAPAMEVIGVAEDAKYPTLRRDAPPTIYASYRQNSISGVTFEVRTAGDPLAAAPLAIDVMGAVDPNLPLAGVRTQEAQIRRAMTSERLLAQLAATLGALTALLAAIGLYGLLSYVVTQRVPEIGVRLALGAGHRAVRWMFLRRAIAIGAVGVVCGLGATVAATGVVRSLLFELSPTSPDILTAAAVVTFAVATAAAWLPARRAARVDPVIALRTE